MLEKISIWPISYLFPGFIVETISGIVAGVGIVSIGLWLCPSRTEKTKKVLLSLTIFIGIASSLGSLVDTSDQNNLILNIIMSLTPVFDILRAGNLHYFTCEEKKDNCQRELGPHWLKQSNPRHLQRKDQNNLFPGISLDFLLVPYSPLLDHHVQDTQRLACTQASLQYALNGHLNHPE
jgi:hypothetical protein